MKFVIKIGQYLKKMYASDERKMTVQSVIEDNNNNAEVFFHWTEKWYEMLRHTGWRGPEQTEINDRYNVLTPLQMWNFKSVIIVSDNMIPSLKWAELLNWKVKENEEEDTLQATRKNILECFIALANILGKFVCKILLKSVNFFMKLRMMLVAVLDPTIIGNQLFTNTNMRTPIIDDLKSLVISIGHLLYSASFFIIIYLEAQF